MVISLKIGKATYRPLRHQNPSDRKVPLFLGHLHIKIFNFGNNMTQYDKLLGLMDTMHDILTPGP